MSVKILSDSGCDLPIELVKEYNIEILPIVVIKDDIEYLDQLTISPKEVFDGMRKGDIYKTAQITPLSFQNKFEDYAKNGDSVIYIGLSSGISGTYQTSLFVREEVKEKYPDLDVDIIDSKAASLGFGLVVLRAAKLAKEGKSKQDIINGVNEYRNNLEEIFTVDDLEYLFRGGRVSRAAAMVGGILNIKPVLEVTRDGKLEPFEKVRGRNKVLKRMVEIMGERGKDADFKNSIIGIGHADDIEAANKIKEMVVEAYGASEFIISDVGAAIGSHLGPGAITLFFPNK